MRQPVRKVRSKRTSIEETADNSLSIDESDSCSAVSFGQSSQRKRGSSSDKSVERKGPWTPDEDKMLVEYVLKNGEGNWNNVRKVTLLCRCGKSCRLRWSNHLKPGLKKGPFTPEEEQTVISLHRRWGNKWSLMTLHLPGRTDNEIKNFWNTRCKRMLRANLPIYPRELVSNPSIENQPIQRNGELILPKLHANHLKYEKLVAPELAITDRNTGIMGSSSSLPNYQRITTAKGGNPPLLRSQSRGDNLTLINHKKWTAEAKAISLIHKACVSDSHAKQFRRGSACVGYRPPVMNFPNASGPQTGLPTTTRAFLGNYANIGCSLPSFQPPYCEALKVELPSLQTSAFEPGTVNLPSRALSSIAPPFTAGDGFLTPPGPESPAPSQSYTSRNGGLIQQFQGHMPTLNHKNHVSLDATSLPSKETRFDSIKVASDNATDTLPMSCRNPLSSWSLTANTLDRKCTAATSSTHDVPAVNVDTNSILGVTKQNSEEKKILQQAKTEASPCANQSPGCSDDDECILKDFGDDYLPDYLKCLINEPVPFSVDDFFAQ